MAGEMFRLDRESFIKASAVEVTGSLVSDGNGSKEHFSCEWDDSLFRQFASRVAANFHFQAHKETQALLEDFHIFDPQSADTRQQGLDATDVLEREDRYLDNITKLLEQANFTPVDKDLYDIAQAQRYLVNLPVQLDRKALDSAPLRRYLQRKGGDAPEFAEHVLIFRRGTGIDRVTDYFAIQKVEIILSRFLEELVLKRLRALVLMAQGKQDIAKALLNTKDELRTKDSPAPALSEPIERIRLEQMQLNFNNLSSKNTIQEPTFRTCAIIFRRKHEKGFHMKMFRDIPMADMEVLYPEKTIGLNATDTISLAATAVAALSTLASSLQAQEFDVYFFFAVLTGLAMVAARIFLVNYNAKYYYDSVLTKTLYDKNLCSDEALLLQLVHSSEEQEVKETLLGYYFLLKDGTATLDDLDKRCESYLSTKLHENVDFEVKDALRKLVDLSLVDRSDDDRYTAVPLRTAVERLDTLWDGITFD